MTDWFLVLAAWAGTLVGGADTAPACLRLGALDVVRSQAFAAADAAGLRDVYSDEELAARDRRALQDYADRGLRIVGLGLLRASCRVVREDDGRVELRVVDRVATSWVVDDDGGRRALPRDGLTRRTVVLERTSAGWRIAAVRRADPGPRLRTGPSAGWSARPGGRR